MMTRTLIVAASLAMHYEGGKSLRLHKLFVILPQAHKYTHIKYQEREEKGKSNRPEEIHLIATRH